MREILFRGKITDNGEWVYGVPVIAKDDIADKDITVMVDNPNEIVPMEGLPLFEQIDPETVGQYTGLTDKKGKKIFEGDICKFREWDNGEMCWIGYVHFEHCQFIISGGANKECPSCFHLVLSRFSSVNIEVIGNIHYNPELLEVSDER